MTSITQLQQTQSLLQIEKTEDRERFTEVLQKTPLNERRKLGISWYPIKITDSGFGIGDYLYLEVERTNEQHKPHQFQSGQPCVLFCNANDASTDRIQGTISFLKGDTMKIAFSVDEEPEWLDDGKLGVDLLFDEGSYQEMEFSLQKVIKAENNRLSELREVILGEKVPEYEDKNFDLKLPNLNLAQNDAVLNVLLSKDVAIIHGPPGTGKTTTLVEAINLTLKKEKQVLVCAPSNLAVDLLVEKLAEKGLRVVRIGNPARVSEIALNSTLDAQMVADKQFPMIKKLRKQATEFQNIGKKYKRNFGASEREQRKLILSEARKISAEATDLEKFIAQNILDNAQVIACTLVGAANRHIFKREYTTIFIDEAAQALEPACWIPITKAQKVVLAGDDCQLPPTVKSQQADKLGFAVTLFEKIRAKKPQTAILLDTQYRMHEQIMRFSGRYFYEDRLQADESVATKVLDMFDNAPFTFIDTAGCGFSEEFGSEGSSLENPEEANLLVKHLNNMLETDFFKTTPSLSLKGGELNKTTPNSSFQGGEFVPLLPKEGLGVVKIGIISPYKGQVKFLEKLLENHPNKNIMNIGTVDGFQGQERDIIYISLVRSNDHSEIGFLSDVRRMNVALTRAKRKLIVIGDSATLANHPFYKKFLAYTEEINAYKSAWELSYL